MDAAKGTLTYAMPGIPGKDPKGLENYARFVQTFVPQYLQQSRAGTLPPNALDVNDPTSLISRAMAPFKRSPAQLLKDRIAEMSTLQAAPESADALPATPGRTPQRVASRPRPPTCRPVHITSPLTVASLSDER